MRTTRQRLAIAVVFVALVLTGCSSSDEIVEETTTTTTPPAETTTSQEATTTMTTSTTVVDTEALARADIEIAFDRQFTVWRSCTADYDVCDPELMLPEVYSGTALENLTNAVTDRQGVGRKNTPLNPDPDFQRIDAIDFTDDFSASVSYCSIDSRMVSTVDAAGADVVFDDSVVHEEGTAFYVLGADGVWRLDRFDLTQRSEEVPLCEE